MKLKLSIDSKFRLAVRSALFAGLAAGVPGAVFAQDAAQAANPDQKPAKEKPKSASKSAPQSALEVAQATPAPAAAPAAAAPEAATELGVVQVTGTRIPQPKLTSSSSLITVNTQEIKLAGYVNIETLINNLPQAFAEFTANDSNGSLGIATANLRNLGSQRTLILIDGKRLIAGDPSATVGSDLNFIPSALIDNVDVLTGGSSAVYGSDAVAGALNFRLKRDFEGFQTDFNRRGNNHGDAHQYNVSFLYGINSASGKGNATVFAGFTKLEALLGAQRGFSQSAFGYLDANGDGVYDTFYAAGSSTSPQGRIGSYDRLYAGFPGSLSNAVNPDGTRTIVPRKGAVKAATTFNFAPFNFFQRPDRRFNLGGFAHYQFNPHLDLYGDVMFMDDRSLAQIAPGGSFFGERRFSVNCDNPLLSSQEQNFLCRSVQLNTTSNEFHPGGVDDATILLGRRTIEFGTRSDLNRHTDYRIVIGAKGNIVDWATYDVSAERGEVIATDVQSGRILLSRAQRALQDTTDASGNIVCKDTTGGCVPFDVFQAGNLGNDPGTSNPDPAAFQKLKSFLAAPGLINSFRTEQVVNGNVTADFTPLGVKTPFTPYGPILNLGYEYRTERLNFTPDSALQAGDLGGNGGATPPTAGAFQVHGYFSELRIPLLDDQFLAKRLSLDAQYRADNYSTAANDVHAWKGGANYAPIEDFGFRANLQRATRAPSINEAFSPRFFNLFNGKDPCAGSNPTATFAECQRTALGDPNFASQFGNIPECISGQCDAIVGGNPNLVSERALTREAGIIITPRYLKGFSATFDYWNISINNPISNVAPNTALTQCILTGNQTLCGLIHRNTATGALFGPSGNGVVDASLLNIGAIRTRGYDIGTDYRFQFSDLKDLPYGMGVLGDVLSDWGGLTFGFNGTFINSLRIDQLGAGAPGGATAFDCAGLFGSTCGIPTPKWRNVFRTTWRAPYGVNLSANWRRIGAVNADVNTTNPNLNSTCNPDGTGCRRTVADNVGGRIPVKQFLDVTFNWQVPWAQGFTINAGANNVTKTRAPVLGGNTGVAGPPFGNNNTFPGFYSDFVGVQFFMGLTYDLK